MLIYSLTLSFSPNSIDILFPENNEAAEENRLRKLKKVETSNDNSNYYAYSMKSS